MDYNYRPNTEYNQYEQSDVTELLQEPQQEYNVPAAQVFYTYTNPQVVNQIEMQYPEMTAEYKRIMMEGYETFCSKQSNYGPHNISVGTNLETDDDKKLSLTGLWFRMNDKIQRLKQLIVLGKQDNVGESVQDTYQDLSVYGIIAQLVGRGKWAK